VNTTEGWHVLSIGESPVSGEWFLARIIFVVVTITPDPSSTSTYLYDCYYSECHLCCSFLSGTHSCIDTKKRCNMRSLSPSCAFKKTLLTLSLKYMMANVKLTHHWVSNNNLVLVRMVAGHSKLYDRSCFRLQGCVRYCFNESQIIYIS
jgi:hypothetical protein